VDVRITGVTAGCAVWAAWLKKEGGTCGFPVVALQKILSPVDSGHVVMAGVVMAAGSKPGSGLVYIGVTKSQRCRVLRWLSPSGIDNAASISLTSSRACAAPARASSAPAVEANR